MILLILLDDHSRVILEPLEDNPDSDYINACYIKASILNRPYRYQNDAWWEGQGHRIRPFPSHNASNVTLALPTMHHFGD